MREAVRSKIIFALDVATKEEAIAQANNEIDVVAIGQEPSSGLR